MIGSVRSITDRTAELDLTHTRARTMSPLFVWCRLILIRRYTALRNRWKFCSTIVNKIIKTQLNLDIFRRFVRKHIECEILRFLLTLTFVFLGQNNLRIVTTSKGKPKMLFEGFSYFQNCKNKDRVYWLCSRNRLLKCTARIITSGGFEILKTKKMTHNHPAESEGSMKREFKDEADWLDYFVKEAV